MKMGLLKSTTKTETNSTIVPCNFTHSYASGQTGSGKTTAYIYPNLKERIKQGHGVLLYDYKGKEHLAVKALAKEAGRINDVVEIGVQWGKSINLLDNLHPAKLNAFLNELYKMSKDNSYWEQSAINYVTGVFNVLWAQDELISSFKNAKIKTRNNTHSISFKSIASVFAGEKSIKDFFRKLNEDLELYEYDLTSLVAESEEDPSTKYGTAIVKLHKFKEVLNKINELFEPLLKSSKMLSSNIFINHIVSITSPIMDIAAQECFNVGQINLAHELRKGKIVVIHTNGIPANILAIFTSTLLESLALEIGKDAFSNLHPVSVFIDEAQRVVSPNLDLGVDVLREAKAELFLSFQNINLLISTLGENKTMALLKNLTSVFRFSNLESGSSKLQTFEYIKGHDSFKAKPFKADPLFLSKESLFEAELEYQKVINLQENYLGRVYDKRAIVASIGEMEVTLLNKNDKRTKVAISNKANKEVIDKFIYNASSASEKFMHNKLMNLLSNGDELNT